MKRDTGNHAIRPRAVGSAPCLSLRGVLRAEWQLPWTCYTKPCHPAAEPRDGGPVLFPASSPGRGRLAMAREALQDTEDAVLRAL